MARPRILSVVWYRVLPARFGGQKGIAEFNAHLSEHIPLQCLCSSDNDPACASYPVDNSLPIGKWQVMSPLHWWSILTAVRKTGSTHLIVEHCYYALAGMLTRQWLGTPWILHAHNIEYLRFREMKKWWWPLLRWLESMACRKASLVLFKTEKDRQHAKNRVTAARDVENAGLACPETSRQEEARLEDLIAQLHKGRYFEGREGEEQEEADHEHGPCEEGEAHPRETLGPEIDDGGEDVDRAEE